ncbi:MAG TPA: DUF1326 domain-containing protein [Candidatus Dormibacteraeota bacterium]|nr:DUF1326 domain-containing protein [Candidatus Dormibacteraeota bacterium]
MAKTSDKVSWRVKGEYFETCSCDYLCPCPTGNLSVRPTKGSCTFAFVHRIDDGKYGDVGLNGLLFAVIGRTPEAMDKGNWSVGLVTDERAKPEQKDAIVAIASGQAGGPMSALAPLISNFVGVESKPIKFQMSGMSRSATVGDLVDQAIEGIPGGNQSEPQYLDNTPHPVSSRLALAKATRSHIHAFGLNWDDVSGSSNGHFATFEWRA